MFIVMLGAPGSGKGTQAELLKEKLNIPQISTGELFRDHMKRQTELGKQITEIMDSGNLVPDETTMKVFKERLTQPDCENGAIFDGIPRTIPQAESLSELLTELGKELDHVLFISLPEEEILKRQTGRWTCKAHGHVYHEIYYPPKQKGICDIDGSELFQREDQKEEAARERINVYKKNTEPLVEYYKNKGILVEIDGTPSIEAIHQEILKKIDLTS